MLQDISSTHKTIVFFEAPHRILRTITELCDAYGQENRQIVCAREMTKIYEQFWRGSVKECKLWLTSLESNSSPTSIVSKTKSSTSSSYDELSNFNTNSEESFVSNENETEQRIDQNISAQNAYVKVGGVIWFSLHIYRYEYENAII